MSIKQFKENSIIKVNSVIGYQDCVVTPKLLTELILATIDDTVEYCERCGFK